MSDYRTASAPPRTIYLITNGHVVCLDADTGADKWRVPLNEGYLAIGLVLVGDWLFAAAHTVCARISARDGTIAWQTQHDDLPSPTSMSVELDIPGGRVVIAGAGKVAALAADTGLVVWTNGLKGLGYHPIVMRIPGAVGTAAIYYQTGKTTSLLEDPQT